MAKVNARVSWVDGQTRNVGTLVDLHRLSEYAVIETDDGLTHIVSLDDIEQPIEQLPETEYPTRRDVK